MPRFVRILAKKTPNHAGLQPMGSGFVVIAHLAGLQDLRLAPRRRNPWRKEVSAPLHYVSLREAQAPR